MTNPLRAEFGLGPDGSALVIDGVARPFRLDLNTLAEMQDIFGVEDFADVLALLVYPAEHPKAGKARMDMRTMRAMLAAGFRSGGWREVTPEQAGEAIPLDQLAPVMAALSRGLGRAFGVGKIAADDEDGEADDGEPAEAANGKAGGRHAGNGARPTTPPPGAAAPPAGAS